MSATDEGMMLDGPRVCSECEGLGVWHGDMSDDELIIECVRDDCPTTWAAPDQSEVSD